VEIDLLQTNETIEMLWRNERICATGGALNGAGHEPLEDCPGDTRPNGPGPASFVGLFRRPAFRILSAFAHSRHSMGFGEPAASQFKACLADAGAASANYVPPVDGPVGGGPPLLLPPERMFAEHPKIKSCMTKMLLGYHCAENIHLVFPNDLERAKQVNIPVAYPACGLFAQFSLFLFLFDRVCCELNDLRRLMRCR
jgi:hypothetical protein